MRVLFDFECGSCAHVFEEFYELGTTLPACPACGASDAKRLITGTRLDPKLGLDAVGFPTMGDKWARVRRQRQQIERKRASEER